MRVSHLESLVLDRDPALGVAESIRSCSSVTMPLMTCICKCSSTKGLTKAKIQGTDFPRPRKKRQRADEKDEA